MTSPDFVLNGRVVTMDEAGDCTAFALHVGRSATRVLSTHVGGAERHRA